MRIRPIVHAAAAAAALLALRAALAGGPDAGPEIRRLIALLESDRPAAEKWAACDRLKQAGGREAVPALARLLADPDLAYWARMALESMPGAEAGAALRRALATAAGAERVGLVNSLGDRRDAEALPALARLLRDADSAAAEAAAAALGKIGGPEAVQALRAAEADAPPAVRAAAVDALLLAADDLRRAGRDGDAAAIFRDLLAAGRPPHVRTAAFRGLVPASGAGGAALVRDALADADQPCRLAALQLVHEAEGGLTVATLAALVDRVPPALQGALLDALARRGDRAALPAVLRAADSPDAAVRVAALGAVAVLGDASAVEHLAGTAARAAGAEQEAARDALVRLRDPAARKTLLARVAISPPAVQAELVRALGRRGETAAVAPLLRMAADGEVSLRASALQALAVLAGEDAVAALARLVVGAPTDADRDGAERALRAVGDRSAQPAALADGVLAATAGAGVPARAALLRVAGRMGGPKAIEALRAAVRDADASLRDSAIRTLADTAGPDAGPDLLDLARGAADPAHRVLALRGYWRMIVAAADRPADERWALCRAGMDASRRPEDRRQGLAALADVPHVEALRLARDLSTDEAVRAEAQTACVRIALAIAARHPAEARAALGQVRDAATGTAPGDEARRALDRLDRHVGLVTGWLAAGPYRREGMECQALFDIPFPPEQPGSAPVAWAAAAKPSDPALAGQADLTALVAGNHAVAYLKARVHSPVAQAVRLEIGSDDGVKVWVNGRLVHANNAIRGLTPGQDQADAALREGWNDLLLKVTQHTLGCGACVRVRRADGSALEGLRFEGE